MAPLSLISAAAAVFLAGCLGGFVNALLVGELKLPRWESSTNVYQPGLLGNVLIGGVAVLVFWGLYGRLGDATVLGVSSDPVPPVYLSLSELVGSILTGVGGGRILSSEISRRRLQIKNDALDASADSLAIAVQSLTSTLEEFDAE